MFIKGICWDFVLQNVIYRAPYTSLRQATYAIYLRVLQGDLNRKHLSLLPARTNAEIVCIIVRLSYVTTFLAISYFRYWLATYIETLTELAGI